MDVLGIDDFSIQGKVDGFLACNVLSLHVVSELSIFGPALSTADIEQNVFPLLLAL